MRLALALLLAAGAQAQPANWSTVTPAAGIAVPLDGGFSAWSTGTGVSGRIELPAYRGRARAELRLATYDADDEAQPEFTLVLATLGWGPAVRLGPVRLGAGGRVGGALFRIDDDTAGNLQSESELAVGAWAGGALVVGRVEAWAEMTGTRVTLSDPVVLVTASGGLAVRLDTPAWLRRVLE